MSNHRCIACIGSNKFPLQHITYAREALIELWPSIFFESELSTPAEDMPHSVPFVNIVVHFNCDESIEEVRRNFKQIERDCGRCSAEKEKGIIRMDIDLLIYDNQILKPRQLRWSWLQHLKELVSK